MSIYKNYLKIALRSMKKNKVYSFINIVGLALGMACCILVLLWVQDELSFDKFHKNSANLYQLINGDEQGWSNTSPWMLAPTLKQDFPEVEKATRFRVINMPVKREENNFYENIAFVDPDFLDMFSFPLLNGDASTALNVTASAVITQQIADKYFPGQDPLGKTIKINQNLDVTVTGVIENVPSNSTLAFDLLLPVKNIGEERITTWYWETGAFVQLADKADVKGLLTKMAGTSNKYDTRIANHQITNSLQPISEMHLHGLNNIGQIMIVYIFSGIALLVLIVACINFINLVTAKAFVRGREIGVRKVVGAGKKQIISQFYGEILLLSLFAFALALLLVLAILPHFNQFAAKQLSLNFFSNPVLSIGAAIIIFLTTLVAGSYPAFMLSSFRPIKVLKDSKSGLKESKISWALVVLQFTVSIVLIVMTIMMNNQISYIQNMDLGFNKDQVISIPMNDQFRSKYEAIKNRLQQHSEIISMTVATSSPNNINNVNPVYWQGRGPDQYEVINYVQVDYDYFETFEMEFVEGRPFSREFTTDTQNYIVNQAAVEYMKMDSPIDKIFSIWTNEGRIIGVVKDFHSRSLHSEIVPVVMTFNRFVPMSQVFIRISPNQITPALELIKETCHELVPDFPLQYEFLDESFQRQYQNDEKIKTLFMDLSSMAIFISCIGLFGLASFVTQRRTKEIGIRKVVGANIFQIISMMLYDFTKWLLLAMIIAVPIAYYTTSKWLGNFAYHIDITVWMFFIAGTLTLGIALLTISWQTLRAATANPVKSLRYE